MKKSRILLKAQSSLGSALIALLLTILLAHPAYSERSFTTPVMVARSYAHQGQSPFKSVSGTMNINLVNITTLPQSVSIEIVDEKLEIAVRYFATQQSLSNPPTATLAPGWSSLNGDWSELVLSSARPTFVQSVTLAANESTQVVWGFACPLKSNLTVADCAYGDLGNVQGTWTNPASPLSGLFSGTPNLNCVGVAANTECGARVRYSARLKIIVAQDRGGLQGQVFVQSGIFNAGAQVSLTDTFSILGGRPF